jgi:hypothetical protein
VTFDFISDIFGRLTELAAIAEPWQQVALLVLVGAIPFIESYLGSFLGVVVGVPPGLAVAAAVIGNIVCTFALIALAGSARSAATRSRQGDPAQLSGRRKKVAKYFYRFGVPGVTFLGPLVLASQITAPALIALGANKRTVYLFQGLAIIAWGVLFGFFGDLLSSWYV